MVWIKFTRPYVVQNHEGRRFAEGELLECNQATAQHFVRRYAAVEVQPEPPKLSEANPEEPSAPAPVRRREPTKPRKVADEPQP
jgi:hypothetical protein